MEPETASQPFGVVVAVPGWLERFSHQNCRAQIQCMQAPRMHRMSTDPGACTTEQQELSFPPGKTKRNTAELLSGGGSGGSAWLGGIQKQH